MDDIADVLEKMINEETERLLPNHINELKDKAKATLAIKLLESIYKTKFYQVAHADLLNFDIYNGIDITAKSYNDSKQLLLENGMLLLDNGDFQFMFIGQ